MKTVSQVLFVFVLLICSLATSAQTIKRNPTSTAQDIRRVFGPLATGGISGSFQLSGSGRGCARIDGENLFIPFPQVFTSAPTLDVTTSSGSSDRIIVSNWQAGRYGFTVTVTTTGQHADEVCANSSINWTAYGTLDPTTATPNQTGTILLTNNGCVNYTGQGVGLAFPKVFQATPQFVTVYGTDASPDSVHAYAASYDPNGATFNTYTYGQNGNQVCGPASLVWTAGNRD